MNYSRTQFIRGSELGLNDDVILLWLLRNNKKFWRFSKNISLGLDSNFESNCDVFEIREPNNKSESPYQWLINFEDSSYLEKNDSEFDFQFPAFIDSKDIGP